MGDGLDDAPMTLSTGQLVDRHFLQPSSGDGDEVPRGQNLDIDDG